MEVLQSAGADSLAQEAGLTLLEQDLIDAVVAGVARGTVYSLRPATQPRRPDSRMRLHADTYASPASISDSFRVERTSMLRCASRSATFRLMVGRGRRAAGPPRRDCRLRPRLPRSTSLRAGQVAHPRPGKRGEGAPRRRLLAGQRGESGAAEDEVRDT